MDQSSKSKNSLVKILLLIIFFPVGISYLLWKTKLPTMAKVIGIIVVWIVFLGLGASGSSTKTETATIPTTNTTVVPNEKVEPTSIPLEQKQADFKELYKKYKIQSQGMLVVESSVVQLSNSASNKAELYLALEKVQKTQEGIAAANLDMKVPDSLKEYKQISSALMDFQIGGNNFSDAIKYFKDYVNKEDLEKLSQAKNQVDRGVERLNSSKDKLDGVAKELEIDVSQIQGIEGK